MRSRGPGAAQLESASRRHGEPSQARRSPPHSLPAPLHDPRHPAAIRIHSPSEDRLVLAGLCARQLCELRHGAGDRHIVNGARGLQHDSGSWSARNRAISGLLKLPSASSAPTRTAAGGVARFRHQLRRRRVARQRHHAGMSHASGSRSLFSASNAKIGSGEPRVPRACRARSPAKTRGRGLAIFQQRDVLSLQAPRRDRARTCAACRADLRVAVARRAGRAGDEAAFGLLCQLSEAPDRVHPRDRIRPVLRGFGQLRNGGVTTISQLKLRILPHALIGMRKERP